PPPGVPVAELPAWLLPAALRQEAIAAAEKRHFLSQAKPPQLTDGNCGCVHEDMVGETYGFYPFWAAAGKPQQVDFSLHTRMAFHAATFGDDGGLRLPASGDAGAEFAVQAERHGTRLDLVVWRNDWSTLLALDDTRLERAARELARSAVAAADTPLRDTKMRWSRFMPFSSPAPTAADGITVFFDNMPNAATNPAGAQVFASFVRRFMLALIAQMRAGTPRDYGLNIALTAQQIGKAPFDYEALFDYVKRAEEPRLDNERIREDGDVYRSRTNVTVRFVVLLPEPTTLSKKALRKSLEDVRDIYGNDRRILLRKIIATVSYNGADPQQFADDLAYFRDNFGGAGFWQMPVHGTAVGDAAYETIARAFRKDATDQTTALCKLVCTNRWAARAVFHLLVLLQIIALLGVIAAGGLRCIGKRPSLGLLALAVALAFVGGSLLNCDPDFKSLREGNVLFWLTLALLFAAALFTTVRPRDPKP
uniref:hypothetical protein n=1 Tax=Ramlibacter sp. TaxID=1917967 RepID=UPI00184B55FF